VLQCVVFVSLLAFALLRAPYTVCCSVLQRDAVCCSVLQCVAVYCRMLQCVVLVSLSVLALLRAPP